MCRAMLVCLTTLLLAHACSGACASTFPTLAEARAALYNSDKVLRSQAACQLALWYTHGSEIDDHTLDRIVGVLVSELESKDRRAEAAFNLHSLVRSRALDTERAKSVAAAMAKLLQTQECCVSAAGVVAAIDARQRDRALSILLEQMQHDYVTAITLIEVAPDRARAIVPAMLNWWKKYRDEKDSPNGAQAIRILGLCGAAAESAVPAILPILKHSDPYLRVHAAQALALINPKYNSHVIQVHIDCLEDKAYYGGAANELGAFGPQAKTAIPRLRSRLRNVNETIEDDAVARVYIVVSLARIEGRPREAIRMLRDALKDSRPMVRGVATYALGTLGPAAAEAVPDMLQKARKYDTEFALFGDCIALGKIGPSAGPDAVHFLTELQKLKNRVARAYADDALKLIRPPK